MTENHLDVDLFEPTTSGNPHPFHLFQGKMVKRSKETFMVVTSAQMKLLLSLHVPLLQSHPKFNRYQEKNSQKLREIPLPSKEVPRSLIQPNHMQYILRSATRKTNKTLCQCLKR